jgi:hypothetical protein
METKNRTNKLVTLPLFTNPVLCLQDGSKLADGTIVPQINTAGLKPSPSVIPSMAPFETLFGMT